MNVTCQAHWNNFMEKVDIPWEAQEVFARVYESVKEDAVFLALAQSYMENPQERITDTLEALTQMAQRLGTNPYTLHFVFFIHCSYPLLRMYQERGVDVSIFWDSMYDLHCKLEECREVEGVWGTFVGWWYRGFYAMTLFKLGRLEFEERPFKCDRYEKAGYTLRKGDTVLNMHIPSCGPLTKDLRLDAYRRAFVFFGGKRGTPMGFVCDSWLLYPDHGEFLAENSNIVDFMRDFEVLEAYHDDEPTASWRIFGRHHKEPFHKLPRQTALQKAYAKRLEEGGKTGGGYGAFFFDGERIL